MAVLEYLEQEKTHYRLTEHEPVYTARQLARVEKVEPQMVAKTVVVQADGKFYLCVLPADRLIDFGTLRRHLGAKKVELANETEMSGLFGDCEIGAEPPLGAHYHLPVLMDENLAHDKQIVFLAGQHTRSVWMEMNEYLRVVKPQISDFAFVSTKPGNEWTGFNPLWSDPFAF
jgi:Ala-tRNA(Pro) deacylase